MRRSANALADRLTGEEIDARRARSNLERTVALAAREANTVAAAPVPAMRRGLRRVTSIDVDARSRGLDLHSIRIGLRSRGSVSARHTPRDQYERGQWVEMVRTAVRSLRALGPGAVEPVTSCGGEVTVPETWWGPR